MNQRQCDRQYQRRNFCIHRWIKGGNRNRRSLLLLAKRQLRLYQEEITVRNSVNILWDLLRKCNSPKLPKTIQLLEQLLAAMGPRGTSQGLKHQQVRLYHKSTFGEVLMADKANRSFREQNNIVTFIIGHLSEDPIFRNSVKQSMKMRC